MTDPRRPHPNPARTFVVRFALLWGALLSAQAFLPSIMTGAIAGTVASAVGTHKAAKNKGKNAAAMLRLLGARPEVLGDTVGVGTATIQIVPECTPVLAFLTLAAAIIAFPGAARHKVLGCAAALPILWVYNLVRILTTLAVLLWAPRLFDVAHSYLWQGITICLLVGLFVAWAGIVRRAP